MIVVTIEANTVSHKVTRTRTRRLPDMSLVNNRVNNSLAQIKGVVSDMSTWDSQADRIPDVSDNIN